MKKVLQTSTYQIQAQLSENVMLKKSTKNLLKRAKDRKDQRKYRGMEQGSEFRKKIAEAIKYDRKKGR